MLGGRWGSQDITLRTIVLRFADNESAQSIRSSVPIALTFQYYYVALPSYNCFIQSIAFLENTQLPAPLCEHLTNTRRLSTMGCSGFCTCSLELMIIRLGGDAKRWLGWDSPDEHRGLAHELFERMMRCNEIELWSPLDSVTFRDNAFQVNRASRMFVAQLHQCSRLVWDNEIV